MSSLLTDLTNCTRCRASAHDLIDEDTDKRGNRTWLVACAFCGYRDRIDAPARSEEPPEQPAAPTDEFRFKYGRFVGMTIAEADQQHNGRRYLEWMLANNQALAPRIEAYLRTATA